MQHITLIRWLKVVVKGLSGTTPVVQIEVVCEPDWEAEESALVRALSYFDEVLGWTLGDLNNLPYLQKCA